MLFRKQIKFPAAEKVRLALKAFGYTPAAISRDLGVNIITAHRMTRKGAPLTLKEISDLCGMMGISTARFFGGQVEVAV